jgi:hypothetical protein
MPNEHSHFSSDYSAWLDQWVVLKVATGESQTELVCTVIAESETALRIRIAEACEVDIYKEMILGVARAWPAQVPGNLDLEPQEENCFSPSTPLGAYATNTNRPAGGKLFCRFSAIAKFWRSNRPPNINMY